MAQSLLAKEEVDLVQESFKELDLKQALLANTLYAHLFALLPEAKKLFTSDMQKQSEMFLVSLKDILEERFTRELDAAWRKAFWQLASQMIDIPEKLVQEWDLHWVFKSVR